MVISFIIIIIVVVVVVIIIIIIISLAILALGQDTIFRALFPTRFLIGYRIIISLFIGYISLYAESLYGILI